MRRVAVAAAVLGLGVGALTSWADSSGAARTAANAPPSAIVFSADREPSVSNEIYRLPFGGRPVDLSRSPFDDMQPVVSPDGRWVAFVRDGVSHVAVYVVHPDGKGLRRVSPELRGRYGEVAAAWSPNSRRLAVTTGDGTSGVLMLVMLTGQATTVEHDPNVGTPGWSPDGYVATALDGGSVDAYTAAGKHVWERSTPGKAPGWSREGLFAAAPVQGVIHVYDSHGHTVFSRRGGSAAWSPDGRRLAVTTGRRLTVLDTHGRSVFARTFSELGPLTNGLSWATNNRVAAVAAPNGKQITVDIRTHRTTFNSQPSLPPFVVAYSRDGREQATTVRSGSGFAIRVGGRVVGHVPGCFDDGNFEPAIASLQFTPDGHSLVYQSLCGEPFANLWQISPDGTGLHRLTTAAAQETQPAVSPDGAQLAFTWSQYTGLSCKGCPQDIHLASADGSGSKPLTSGDGSEFNTNPSWSPDGTRVLYERGTIDSFDLAEIAAAGGQPTDLHIRGYAPAWGPSRIAYLKPDVNPAQVWTARPNGTDPQLVGKGNITALTWSHDGRLAWLAAPQTGGVPWVIIRSGSTTRRVNLPFAAARGLAWSPDSTRFAIVAQAKGAATFDVYTLTTEGKDIRRITRNVDAFDVAWGS